MRWWRRARGRGRRGPRWIDGVKEGRGMFSRTGPLFVCDMGQYWFVFIIQKISDWRQCASDCHGVSDRYPVVSQ